MEHRLPIPLAISSKGIGELVPSAGIPLDRESLARKRHVESTSLIPRQRELEVRLWDTPRAEHLSSKALQRRPVTGANVTFGEDAPDLLDTRLASSGDLFDDSLDIICQDPPLGDQGHEDRGQTPRGESWR